MVDEYESDDEEDDEDEVSTGCHGDIRLCFRNPYDFSNDVIVSCIHGDMRLCI